MFPCSDIILLEYSEFIISTFHFWLFFNPSVMTLFAKLTPEIGGGNEPMIRILFSFIRKVYKCF